VLDDELVTIWLDSIDRVETNAYKPVMFEALPAAVRGDSSLWADRFFTDAANPHNHKAAVKWTYHLSTESTPDILRGEHIVQKYALEVIETRSYLITRVRGTAPQSRSAVLAAAEDLLRRPESTATWSFQFPEVLNEGSRFSTNPTVGPLRITTWEDRTDGGVRGGVLYFLRFKKSFELLGYPDLRRWFDESFRRKP
jgi:hypothetical protein